MSSNFRDGMPAGFVMKRRLRIPALGDDEFASIETNEDFITRHIDKKYIDSTLRGYFRFGTLAGYRPAEEVTAHRLGDKQEGLRKSTFNSKTGLLKHVELGMVIIENVAVDVNSHHIVEDIEVNDYCSCASCGVFDADRAEKMSRLNSDLSAFVTYSLPTLKRAILNHLLENKLLHNYKIIGRKVEYGQKDETHLIGDYFFRRIGGHNDIKEWLSTAFIKSDEYKHEQEFRMILLNPSGIGRLAEDRPPLIINDSAAIASSIVAYGEF